MQKDNYLLELEKRLSHYYDTQRNFVYEGKEFPLYAKFHQRNERYIASKKVVVYGIEQNEHIFFTFEENINLDKLKELLKIFESAALNLVVPTDEHMSTLIRGVIGTRGIIPTDVIKFIENYKFYKSFLFGLKGWVNVAINLVDLDNRQNKFQNKMGKEGRDLF